MSVLRFTKLCISAGMVLLALSIFPAAGQTSTEVHIAVHRDVHADYLLFLAERDPNKVTYFGGDYARRDVVELILMQQALTLGGFTKPLQLVDQENYSRGLRDLLDGKTLAISSSIWYQDLVEQRDKLHISPPLVREGEFIAGIYTSPKNQRAQASKTLEQLNQLRAVTSRQWKPDGATLQHLGFTEIMYTPRWINMARMVNAGRVDVTLSQFAMTPNKEIMVEGIRLIPIEGIKIAIDGSRHWPVSKQHPLGDEFYTALAKGIEELRKAGTIERAYQECGFFHPDLAGWKLLNPTKNNH